MTRMAFRSSRSLRSSLEPRPKLRATVEIINGYSAHADRTELAAWIGAVRRTSPNLRQLYLVHGEAAAQEALAGTLVSQRYAVTCPVLHDKISS